MLAMVIEFWLFCIYIFFFFIRHSFYIAKMLYQTKQKSLILDNYFNEKKIASLFYFIFKI